VWNKCVSSSENDKNNLSNTPYTLLNLQSGLSQKHSLYEPV
jgi:hypothetical protein